MKTKSCDDFEYKYKSKAKSEAKLMKELESLHGQYERHKLDSRLKLEDLTKKRDGLDSELQKL